MPIGLISVRQPANLKLASCSSGNIPLQAVSSGHLSHSCGFRSAGNLFICSPSDAVELSRRVQRCARRSFKVQAEVGGEGKVDYEVRVCTQRACRKSGSLQTLDILRSIAPPNVTVESSGCLGKCGSGPNLVVLPSELVVSHCNTAAQSALLLARQCKVADPDNNLKALALKEQGNKAFENGDLIQAEKLFTEAIAIRPSGGLHFIFANRSALFLALGDKLAALKDAKEACNIAPHWAQGYLQQMEALFAMGDYHGAQSACRRALYFDPSLRRSKSVKDALKTIESKLTLATVLDR